MRRNPVLLAAAALVLAGAASACGGDGTEVSTGATTTTGRGATTTHAASDCTLAGATPDAKAAPPAGGSALLTDVRDGRQPCADRVVFEFRDAVPGYTVRYESGPFTFGESGQPVTIAGSAFVVVRLSPAAGVDLTQPDAPATYTGPAQITPHGLAHVQDIRRLSDFEGQLVWVIGVDSARPFTVATLTGPPRVYLDLG